MNGQLSFGEFDASPQPTDGLFFAVFPDAFAAADISRFAQRQIRTHGLQGRLLSPQRLHVSLHNLGSHLGVPRDIVGAACEAAAAAVMPAFEVAFNRVVSFAGRSGARPFVLHGDDGVAGLAVLHQRLGVALQKVGLWRWVKSQYVPHMTLLYDNRCVAERAVDAVNWTVREFVLVHSLLGQGRYVFLEQWKLRG